MPIESTKVSAKLDIGMCLYIKTWDSHFAHLTFEAFALPNRQDGQRESPRKRYIDTYVSQDQIILLCF